MLTGLVLLALMVGVGGCTNDAATPTPTPTATPLPSSSTESTTTLEPKPVPLDIEVVRVLGSRLKRPHVELIERQVGRAVSAYFNQAFLDGDYPRRNFSAAFGSFSRGAAQEARRDRRLLTNASVGGVVESVTPRQKVARLDVLVPNKIAAGVTARVRLVFLQERARGADQKVTLSGRLLLTRKKSGGWQIFGYDVARSAVPAAQGGNR